MIDQDLTYNLAFSWWLAAWFAGNAIQLFRDYRSNRNREARQETSENLITSAVTPARWIVGRHRTPGVLFFADEALFPERKENFNVPGYDPATFTQTRTLYMAVLLSEGEIDAVERVWVNNMPMPLKADRDGWMKADPTGFAQEIINLETRRNALSAHRSDPVIARLYDDLDQQATNLKLAQEGPPWYSATAVEAGATVRVAFDYGQSGMSSADSAIQEAIRRAARESVDNKVLGWGSAYKVTGLSWALIEVSNFVPAAISGESMPAFTPFEEIPSVEFLVRGAKISASNTWTESPAEILRWFLTERCRVPEADIQGLDFANRICNTKVEVPNATTSNALGTAWLASAYGTNLPSAAIQEAFLVEINHRYAVAASDPNAPSRYSFNGVIQADEERGSVQSALVGAMAGILVDDGGIFRVLPGTSEQGTSAVIQEEDLIEEPEWLLAPPNAQRVNVLTGNIPQDKRRSYVKNSGLEVGNANLIASDGRWERNIGDLQGSIDEIQARRLMAILLRQGDPRLLRMSFVLSPGLNFRHYGIKVGDRVRLNFPHESVQDTTIWRVLSVSPTMDGNINVSVIEDQDSIYADDLVQTFGDLWGGQFRKAALPPLSATNFRIYGQWIKVNDDANPGKFRFVLELTIFAGTMINSFDYELDVASTAFARRIIGQTITLSNPDGGERESGGVYRVKFDRSPLPRGRDFLFDDATVYGLKAKAYSGENGALDGELLGTKDFYIPSVIREETRGLMDFSTTAGKPDQSLTYQQGRLTPFDPIIVADEYDEANPPTIRKNQLFAVRIQPEPSP